MRHMSTTDGSGGGTNTIVKPAEESARVSARTHVLSIPESAYEMLCRRYFGGLAPHELQWAEIDGGLVLGLQSFAMGRRREYRLHVKVGSGAEWLELLLDEQWREVPEPFWQLGREPLPTQNEQLIRGLANSLTQAGTRFQYLATGLGAVVGCASNTDQMPSLEYLEPYFSVHQSSRTSVNLVVIHDGDLHSLARDVHRACEWQSWNRIAGQAFSYLRGDGFSFFRVGDAIYGAFRMPLLRDAGQVFYLRERPQQPWYVIADPGVPHSQNVLARTVRIFANAQAQADGAVCLHAAGMVADGRAYLICGDQWAGKTSNLLTALKMVPGTRLLSNDRIILRVESGDVVAYGYPHLIGVRAGTARANPELSTVWSEGETSASTGGEFDHAGAESPFESASGKHAESSRFFRPLDLADRLGTSVAVRAPLAGIIVLEKETVGLPLWEPLHSLDAREFIARHRHSHYDNAETFWSELLPAGEREPRLELVAALSAIPPFVLRSYGRLREAWKAFPGQRADGESGRVIAPAL